MICENCGCEHGGSYGSGRFCSRSCANTRKHSNETKQKISKSLYTYVKKNIKVKTNICKVCKKEYRVNKKIFPGCTKTVCSTQCREYYITHYKEFLSDEILQKLSEAGRTSVKRQANSRRSLNEKYFYELCLTKFKNVKHNVSMFNGWDADIIIEDLKIAVLWNGKWHYEKIKSKHSVEQVQNRDKIKIKNIKNCGYIPYIIKDMGKYNKNFVENEFEKFLKIYNADLLGRVPLAGS